MEGIRCRNEHAITIKEFDFAKHFQDTGQWLIVTDE